MMLDGRAYGLKTEREVCIVPGVQHWRPIQEGGLC
jgi:hypothetical protein